MLPTPEANLKVADLVRHAALSMRQPYAELILRGIKTVEYCTRPTRIIGERFYIYASKAKAARPIWSDDLRVATPPKWMIELAEPVGMMEPGALLPTGVIVGSAVISNVIPPDPSDGEAGLFRWNLHDIKHLATPMDILGRSGSIRSDTQQETRPGNGAPGRV
jgi:hypothetical protein